MTFCSSAFSLSDLCVVLRKNEVWLFVGVFQTMLQCAAHNNVIHLDKHFP